MIKTGKMIIKLRILYLTVSILKINFSPKNEGEIQNILEPIISLGKIDILAKNKINKNIRVNEIEPNTYFDQEQNINLIEYQPIIQNNIIPLVEKEMFHKEIQPVTRIIIQPVIQNEIQHVTRKKIQPVIRTKSIIQSNIVGINNNIVPSQKVIQKK